MTAPLKLPTRDPDGHKGTFGTVAIVGGCADSRSRMIGAPAIAALAALRAGAGLARVLCPSPILNDVISITPSATGVALPTSADGALIAHEAAEVFDLHTSSADSIVIGPGLGWNPDPLDPLAEGTRANTSVSQVRCRCLWREKTMQAALPPASRSLDASAALWC